jgi:hypothetical protein
MALEVDYVENRGFHWVHGSDWLIFIQKGENYHVQAMPADQLFLKLI